MMSEQNCIDNEVHTLKRKLVRSQRLLLLVVSLPVLAIAMGQREPEANQTQTEETQAEKTARPATMGKLKALSNRLPLTNAISISDPDGRSRLLIAPNQNGNICMYLYKNGAQEPVKYIKVETLLNPYP